MIFATNNENLSRFVKDLSKILPVPFFRTRCRIGYTWRSHLS